jgi:signal transduction histidine kinase
MSGAHFDHDWQLGELIDSHELPELAAALARLLGGDLALADGSGRIVWGTASPGARRQAVVIELDPVATLYSASASAAALAAAGELLHDLLRTRIRYRMASALHLEVVAEDFDSLKREHARLAESEARYRQLAGELDARVKTQLAELEERQQMLYAAERLASIGQLAAGMAHEINNPLGFARSNLGSFRGYLQKFAALRDDLDHARAAWQALDLDFVLADGDELLDETLTGLERIAHIVADLKAFSNVDRSSEAYADLNTCLREAAAVIEAQLPAGIGLRLDLLPLPPIVCLPGHLKQAFYNILHNARQAIIDSGRPGTIILSSAADAGRLTVRIRDNGIGMRPEQLAHAFEPFYTTRDVGHGVGLGLATARSIIHAHGGTIALDSAVDAGTTVTLSFPIPDD